jgi:hypothetical protein
LSEAEGSAAGSTSLASIAKTDDPHFERADWHDAEILPPPDDWGGGLPDGVLPKTPRQIDPATGKPRAWPLRGTIVHWATLLRDIPPGRYDLRCRSIDANGIAQPMPRPFLKSGHNAIQKSPFPSSPETVLTNSLVGNTLRETHDVTPQPSGGSQASHDRRRVSDRALQAKAHCRPRERRCEPGLAK